MRVLGEVLRELEALELISRAEDGQGGGIEHVQWQFKHAMLRHGASSFP